MAKMLRIREEVYSGIESFKEGCKHLDVNSFSDAIEKLLEAYDQKAPESLKREIADLNDRLLKAHAEIRELKEEVERWKKVAEDVKEADPRERIKRKELAFLERKWKEEREEREKDRRLKRELETLRSRTQRDIQTLKVLQRSEKGREIIDQRLDDFLKMVLEPSHMKELDDGKDKANLRGSDTGDTG